MENIGVLFSEFYRDLPSQKSIIVYENEKRHFPMVDFDAFLKSIPSNFLTAESTSSSFLKNVPELVTLYWGYKLNDKEENGGEYNLYHLLNALTSNGLEGAPEKDVSTVSPLIWIDSHPHTGDGVQVLFDAVKWPDWQQAGVLLSDENGKIHPLHMNYKDYVKFTFITKGFYNWQYLFVNDKSVVSADKKQLMATYFLPMKKVLPQLFPSVDYTELFKRIDQF